MEGDGLTLGITIASSAAFGILLKWILESIKEWNRERRGKATAVQKKDVEIASLKRIIYRCQYLLLQAGVDARLVPGIEGEPTMTTMEDPDRPDIPRP